jgi:hypothetical protein
MLTMDALPPDAKTVNFHRYHSMAHQSSTLDRLAQTKDPESIAQHMHAFRIVDTHELTQTM